MLELYNPDGCEVDWECTVWWWKLNSVKYDFTWNMQLLEDIQNA